MKILTIYFFFFLITILGYGCAADIQLSMTDVSCGTVKTDYKSARKAAISMSCDGVTVITGEVITDDPAALVSALGKSTSDVISRAYTDGIEEGKRIQTEEFNHLRK